jgi:hypothetical protein
MMKLHYIDEYQEVDIPEIIYRIFDIRCLADINEMLNISSWHAVLIETIDDAIISYLNLNETIRLEDTFSEKDLTSLREEVIDRLKYMFK